MGDLLYPAIPEPISSLDSLLETTRALKEAVELLNGMRGTLGTSKALTASDLTYVFGTSPLPPGTAPPPTGPSNVSAAVAAARAAAQRALLDLKNALENASNNLNNSQEAALAEFQSLLDDETQFRIDGDDALQQQVDLIVLTNDEGAIAGIAHEAGLRISADDALAGEIHTLSGTVDGNTAAISSEAIARAHEDESLALQINSVTAIASGQHTFVQSTAPVGTVGAPLTVGDIWLDTAHGNLMKVWDGANWTDRQDLLIGVNAAGIVDEQTARADADTAMAQDITTLFGKVEDVEGLITDEAFLRVQNDNIIAGTVTTLTGTVGGNTLAISQEAVFRADADGLLGQRIDTIVANGPGDAAALVEAEEIARVQGDEALADDLHTVSTTVDGHTTTITQHSTSLNGLMAEYSVVLNANGHIAGFQINSSATAPSEFIVQADKFKIVSGTNTGLAAPFSVVGANTFINRVVVADEVVSNNYAQDGLGNPTLGFRAGSDGLLRAYGARFNNVQSIGGTFDTGTFINLSAVDAVFIDMQARGGSFTQRPVLLATPNFRNGVPDNLCSGTWFSPGNIQWSPSLSWLTMGATRFHRTPDTFYAQFSQARNDGSQITSLQQYFVPVGKRLPPKIVGDLAGANDVVEWRDDGTVARVLYNSNGGVSTTNIALGWWMFDVEIDPLNLAGKTKMYAGLGFSRYPQPLRVPTGITSISFKIWGAGGAKDDGGSAGGGPGGYVAGTFAVGTRLSAALIKHGDMLWLIPGEGGKSKAQDVIFGFGGRGQAQQRRASGGGLSGVFIYSVTRANALLIAGGGGGAEGGQKGDGGGATSSGGATGGVTDDEIMTGLPWAFDGTNQKAAGGGGFVGGGYLAASGGNAGGRGGTNFVHASATATTNSFSTTQTPPNSGDADYVARRYCLGNLADVGEGKTSTVSLETGGNGLIVVSFA